MSRAVSGKSKAGKYDCVSLLGASTEVSAESYPSLQAEQLCRRLIQDSSVADLLILALERRLLDDDEDVPLVYQRALLRRFFAKAYKHR